MAYDSLICELNILRTASAKPSFGSALSYLEYRGAIDLLTRARRSLRVSGWEGNGYKPVTMSTSEAWCIIEEAEKRVRQEIERPVAVDDLP